MNKTIKELFEIARNSNVVDFRFKRGPETTFLEDKMYSFVEALLFTVKDFKKEVFFCYIDETDKEIYSACILELERQGFKVVICDDEIDVIDPWYNLGFPKDDLNRKKLLAVNDLTKTIKSLQKQILEKKEEVLKLEAEIHAHR